MNYSPFLISALFAAGLSQACALDSDSPFAEDKIDREKLCEGVVDKANFEATLAAFDTIFDESSHERTSHSWNAISARNPCDIITRAEGFDLTWKALHQVGFWESSLLPLRERLIGVAFFPQARATYVDAEGITRPLYNFPDNSFEDSGNLAASERSISTFKLGGAGILAGGEPGFSGLPRVFPQEPLTPGAAQVILRNFWHLTNPEIIPEEPSRLLVTPGVVDPGDAWISPNGSEESVPNRASWDGFELHNSQDGSDPLQNGTEVRAYLANSASRIDDDIQAITRDDSPEAPWVWLSSPEQAVFDRRFGVSFGRFLETLGALQAVRSRDFDQGTEATQAVK